MNKQITDQNRIIALSITLVLTLSLMLPLVSAIGVSPARKEITFEPNKQEIITQKVINNEHKDLKAVIYARGELEPYIKILDSLIIIQAAHDQANFRYEVNLPNEFRKPGRYGSEIVVMELPSTTSTDETASIGAVGSVISELYVRVPFPDKYAEAKLVIESQGQDKPVRFVLPVFNYGSKKIVNIQAHIDILGATYEKIGEIDTNGIGLPVKGQSKIQAEWFNPELNPGVYHAKATITYDGKKIEQEENFKIGDLAVEIIDLRADKFKLGSIAAIDIFLENKWNSKISGIYGILAVTDQEGTEYEQTKTTSIDLNSLSRGKVTAYWDTRDLPVGFYDLNLEIHYEGKTTKKIIGANVNIDSIKTDFSPIGQAIVGAPSRQRDTMLYLLVLLLVAMNIGWFVYVRKKRD